ncbi:GNAT family N-acetyltransferase [Tautonia sociabilis]|uniref:N-acetyltransferase n=1 Tax=Tautonia sociabilis TaxID=2080755 RepID=A0A432MNU5_9BACT|nr:N-acetyltransferase [Tautonia sociabilis]RUL88990.1 N-acetyltransferase [Tautonia sociabilis]
MDLILREERPDDRDAIRLVNERAFDRPDEANLVDALRSEARPFVSIVAEQGGVIVGHLVFSPVTIAGQPAEGSPRLLGLAPMAVLPDHQRRGVGSALVRLGFDTCRALGAVAVVVLGHPEYYPRFGFRPASSFGLRSEYDVPDDVFLALELRPGSLSGRSGSIRYHEAFASF